MIDEANLYEEYYVAPPWLGWVLVLGIAAAVLGLGWFIHTRIADTPRMWDFGELADTPGESAYSTFEPKVRRLKPQEKTTPQRQLPPLPLAKPLKPLDPKGYEQTRQFNE